MSVIFLIGIRKERLYGSLPEHVVTNLRNLKDHPGRQFARAEQFLDKGGFGPLWLNNPQIANCVKRSILKGSRELDQYALLAYVIMPNHVHLLIDPRVPLKRITGGIKGVSARDANCFLRRTGQPFWQCESFDHWLRTPTEAEKLRNYIEDNPLKAGLVASKSDWPWSSASK
jgi:putative transposase